MYGWVGLSSLYRHLHIEADNKDRPQQQSCGSSLTLALAEIVLVKLHGAALD